MIKEKFNFIIEKIKNSNTKQRIIAGGVALGLVLGIVGISVGVNLHSQKVANGGLTNKQLKKAVAAEQKSTNSIDTEEYTKLVKEDVESKTASMTEEEKKEVEKKVEENGGNKENPIDVSNAIAEVKPEETPAKEEEVPQPSEPTQVEKPSQPEQQPSQPEQQPSQPAQQPSQKPQEETPKPQPEPEKPKPNNPSAGTYNAEMSSWLNQVLIDNGIETVNLYGLDEFKSIVDRGEIPAAGTIKVDPISGEMNGPTAVVGPYYFNTKTEDSQYWMNVFNSSLTHDSLYIGAVRVRVFNDGNGGWYVNAYYMTFE